MRKKLITFLIFATILFFNILYLFFAYCDDDSLISFHLVRTAAGPNCMEMTIATTGERLYLEKESKLTIRDIAYAKYDALNPSGLGKEWADKTGGKMITERLLIKFTEDGKQKLHKLTSENIMNRLGIIINGDLIMAPEIFEPLSSGEMLIAGNWTTEEIKAIAQRINELAKK